MGKKRTPKVYRTSEVNRNAESGCFMIPLIIVAALIVLPIMMGFLSCLPTNTGN